MPDLTDFGVDVSEEPDEDDEETDAEFHAPSYPRGRCPAVTMKSRKRCKAPVSRMRSAGDMCAVHGRERDPWTIHDDPEELVIITGKLDTLRLEDLDPEEVEFDLGRVCEAIDAVRNEFGDHHEC